MCIFFEFANLLDKEELVEDGVAIIFGDFLVFSPVGALNSVALVIGEARVQQVRNFAGTHALEVCIFLELISVTITMGFEELAVSEAIDVFAEVLPEV